ncbi:MAG: helix-turn-helix transcriptional regulator [Anaerolineae bacterium]|nr:helix-turn-helix transcriptional regulator [Anaerolineae bacterium]
MYKYGQYCPIAKAVEILGDRWTLLIVRDLLVGTCHFNDLERGLPGISRALLSERLRRLQRMGLVEKVKQDDNRQRTVYLMTPAGQELQSVIQSLLTWGARWAFDEPEEQELDAGLLMWWIRDRIHTDRLPQPRVMIRIDFTGASDETFWLILTQDDVSICLTDPGFDLDIVITADLATFFQIWLGRVAYFDAVSTGLVQVDAVPALAEALPTWFAYSLTAPAVRAAIAEQRVEV